MWKCHKCGKPVYFAERKQSLGYDWHPECLRCEECGKRLNPGQHAEHKSVPFCHVPCYGALFGPQLFGHGTRVESHKSFGQQKDNNQKKVFASSASHPGGGPVYPRNHIDSKLKVYNQFYEGKSNEIRSREVNGRLILEGSLRVHWGVLGVIHLKENDDQRTLITIRKRNSMGFNDSDTDSDEDDKNNSFSSTDVSKSCSSSDLSSSNTLNSSNATLNFDDFDKSDTGIESMDSISLDENSSPSDEFKPRSLTLPSKLDLKNVEWDELDDLLQVERRVNEKEKIYQTMPVSLKSQGSVESNSSGTSRADSSSRSDSSTKTLNGNNPDNIEPQSPQEQDDTNKCVAVVGNLINRSMSGPDCLERLRDGPPSPEFDRSSSTLSSFEVMNTDNQEVVVRRAAAKSTGSTAIKRRHGGKRLSRSKIVKRRCSINGHFYDRETSFFTPPRGSQMSVWITSLVNTQEVINLILEKYKVDSDPKNFALFIVRDNGEQKRLKDDEYPLLTRVLLGPHEDVARLFLMDGHNTPEVSCEVAQFLNLTLAECRAILKQYQTQEEREVARVREKFVEMRRRIKQRMEDLKVRL